MRSSAHRWERLAPPSGLRATRARSRPVDKRGRAPLWERLAEHGALLLALAGLAVYGILVLAYSEFFQELGINPADVGVDYGKTLGGAAGLALVATIVVLVAAAWLVRGAIGKLLQPDREPLTGAWLTQITVAIATAVLLASLILLHNKADSYADRIKSGRRVEPYRLSKIPLLNDIELLAIRSEPAIVRPIQRRRTLPKCGRENAGRSALEKLACRSRLLYLGQSKGVTVVYDPIQQRALYIPTAAALVATVNCETRRAQHFRLCKLAETRIR